MKFCFVNIKLTTIFKKHFLVIYNISLSINISLFEKFTNITSGVDLGRRHFISYENLDFDIVDYM
ncbi:hypothetical protein NQ317_010086 [Molorchus minor]|uniref:Uncharacterized protein n=1 Tax=Molorchus minor TaxID=1323400 RepID=A0ABQ9JJ25_9CUCU|nr:hypothetical protein NQ317_010086 [Molorchus minor]